MASTRTRLSYSLRHFRFHGCDVVAGPPIRADLKSHDQGINMRIESTIAAGLTMALATMVATPAQASSSFSNVNRLNTTQCLDSATEDDSKLQMWHCDSGNDEQWLFLLSNDQGGYKFVNQRTGLCATSPTNWGQAVTMKACEGAAANQLWYVYRTLYDVSATAWRNGASSYCLWSHGASNGTVLVVGNCEANDTGLYWQKR